MQDQGEFFNNDQDLDMDYDAVGQLHFGGGFTRKEGTIAETEDRPKTKKQAGLPSPGNNADWLEVCITVQ